MAEITPEAKKPDDITNDLVEIVQPSIEKMIYVIRDKQVMLDSDLAVLYQVETGALNRAVKRNISRFPEDFRFQLTKEEYQNLRCQTGISSLVIYYLSFANARFTTSNNSSGLLYFTLA